MSSSRSSFGLNARQRASLEETGFLAIDHLLDEEDLTPLENEYEQRLDRVARDLRASGKLPSSFDEMEFEERFSRILSLCPKLHAFFNVSLPLSNHGIDPAVG